MGEMANTFTETQMLTLWEIARVALADADLFDFMAERLDVSDSNMIRLRDQLEKVMQ